MGKPYRSRRAEILDLRYEMRSRGATTAQVAATLRERYNVGSRVAFRLAHGLTQQQVADTRNSLWPAAEAGSPLTHKHVSYWEAWPAPTGRAPSVDVLNCLARIYRCRAADLLDGEDHTDPPMGGSGPTTARGPAGTSDLPVTVGAPVVRAVTDVTASDRSSATNRREFAITTGLGALGVMGHWRSLFLPGVQPRSVGVDHLELVMSIINRLEQADAALGGDVLYEFAADLQVRVTRWLQACNHGKAVGEGLQTALGDLEAWMGWLAFDAGQRTESRRILQEAVVRARITDDPALEVRALTYLSLVIRQERPRESIRCADAAQRIAAAWATPRLRCLLHLRAAHAYAEQADTAGFSRAMAKAMTEMDQGSHDDDPPYIRFVTPLEVTGVEGLSYLAMGRADRAASTLRTLAGSPDPARQRNHAYYTVQLADAERQRGDIAEAANIAMRAVPAVTAIRSGRTSRLLAKLRSDLLPHGASASAVRDFADSYDGAVPR